MKYLGRVIFWVGLCSLFFDMIFPDPVVSLGVNSEKVSEQEIAKIPSEILVNKPKQIHVLLPEIGFSPEKAVLSDGTLLPEVGLITLDMEYKDDGSSYGKAAFPKEGRLVGTGNVIMFSGLFELKNGVLSYQGKGILGPILIDITLSKIDFLTGDEKAAADSEAVENDLLLGRRKKFLSFLEGRGESELAESVRNENTEKAEEKWEAEQVSSALDETGWEELKKFTLLRMWHQFEREESKDSGAANNSGESALPSGTLFAKEVVFSMVPESGTIDFSVGESHIFNLKYGDLVCRYKEDPYISSTIIFLGQKAEVRLTERQVAATVRIENGSLGLLLPQLDSVMPKSVLSQGRFDGILHVSLKKGVELQGRFFDGNTEGSLQISPLPALIPIALDTVRLSVEPGSKIAFQARTEVYGVPAELFAGIDKERGFLARIALRSAPVRTYIPQLPAQEFDPLSFSGKLEWSKEEGIILRGKLEQSQAERFPLWGFIFDSGSIDFNLSRLQGSVSGDFSIFDLKARGAFLMRLGKDPEVSFAAELFDDTVESWAPGSLESFLKGTESQVVPFKFKKLSLVGGFEGGTSPVKTLQNALFKKSKNKKKKEKKEKKNVKSVEQNTVKNTSQEEGKKSEKVVEKPEKLPVLATASYEPKKKLRFFCAVAGEAFIFNELCFAAVKVHTDSKGAGLLLVAEPSGEWSLGKGFPKIFAHNSNDKPGVEYLKNIIGGAALSNLSFVLSSFKDIETGVERGLNVMGALAYEGAFEENPLFRPFLAQSHKLPIYLKKDGRRGIGITVGMVLNPIDFQNSVLRLGVSTGDVGIFFRGGGMEEVGLKELTGEVRFYPFSIMGTGNLTVVYKGGKEVRPMKMGMEVKADKVGIGGSLSGVGDFDFAKFLPLFLGKDLAAAINQTAIIKDWGMSLETTWVAIASIVGAIGTAVPTLGIGTIIGFITFVLTSIDTFGISGGIEIGQGYDPLLAQFTVQGGWDLTSLIFEVLYEKPGGFFSMAMFILDMYMQLYHKMFKLVGIKYEKPDARKVQAVLEQFFPLDLEKFYLKFVPLGTKLGEITLPFGIGGSLYFSLFGKTIGADLMVDSNGAYAVGFVDPIDWGIYKLVPSKTLGNVAKKLEDSYRDWGLLSFASEQDHEKKIKLEASAHIEKGFSLWTDFDVMVADMFGGSFRGGLSFPKGLDLQGSLEVKLPGLLEQLGLPVGSAKLWVKGWQLDFDNPMAMLYQGDPKNIALEVGYSNDFCEAIQKTVRGALDGAKNAIEGAVNGLLANVLQKAGEQELAALRAERERVCGDTGLFGVPKDLAACGAAELALRSTEARNEIFKTLDQAGLNALPELVRNGVTAISNLGLGGIKAGRFVFDSIANIVEIKKIWWRGSVVDIAEGRIPPFQVDIVLLGKHIVGDVGGVDLKDPLPGVRNLIDNTIAFVGKELAKVLQIPNAEVFKIAATIS